ncbi:hypothetical protein [Piscinibacter koreensis]|uniref:Uncharacterized protein n=1 Tax=Piscinibacter koreensis TaxID=2742824 RepID=A0A7Y6NLS0_9BURK|nr:hypothetical protein [Schlegelella koreensis]NUZ05548.1 hypothetical protein [Schlegelella koreensis]
MNAIKRLRVRVEPEVGHAGFAEDTGIARHRWFGFRARDHGRSAIKVYPADFFRQAALGPRFRFMRTTTGSCPNTF